MSLSGREREEFEKKLEAYVGVELGVEERAKDPVGQAAIRIWCEAMGDGCPAYTDPEAAAKSVHGGIVAPPTMLQSWILGGVSMASDDFDPRDKQKELHRLFDAHGYTGVVATNTDQEYKRYLRPGDEIRAETTIESVSEQKATGLGIGYFIETHTRFFVQDDEEVGSLTFRVLKFEPGEQQAAAPETESGAPAKPQRIKPALGHDNKWWWDCLAKGELAIQRCSDCQTLRHPPRPMCGECQSTSWDFIHSTGEGTIFSFVVVRHPEVPGYTYPLVVAVIDLAEGTRYVGNVVDVAAEDVKIGMKVLASVELVDDEMMLPVFRPA
jgi:uncharacterized OB-fold protein/acyl dehydratase